MEIRELSVDLVYGPGLDGRFGALEQALSRRMSEIINIFVSFRGIKTEIFPDVLWKVACAIEDTLRGVIEMDGQRREQGLAFLGFVAAVFAAVEPKPIPKSWGIVGFSLGRAVDALNDSQPEACFNAVQQAITSLWEFKKELLSAKTEAGINAFFAGSPRSQASGRAAPRA